MRDEIRNNTRLHRYELETDGYIAAAWYKLTPGVITFTHTEVPKELAGQGIGTKLARGALEAVRRDGLKVVAKCPFIAAYMARRHEYDDLLLVPES